jgi:N-acetylglutamate synthase-like GNAT family acetyltransferase
MKRIRDSNFRRGDAPARSAPGGSRKAWCLAKTLPGEEECVRSGPLAMSVSNYQVRRATIDDMVALKRLWLQADLRMGQMEKRLREIQVVETADGQVLGAVGLEVDGPQGRIHSEVYAQPELSEALRPRLWERLQTLARNHGLTRLWLQQASSVFWLEHGFEPASGELREKIPSSWREQDPAHWLTLQLREERAELSIEQELALFRQFQQEQGSRMVRHARTLRVLATVIVILVLAIIGWACLDVFLHLNRRGKP